MARDSASLMDIIKAGRQVLQFAEGLTREQLELDFMRQSAILYQIIIVGEATKRLSKAYRLRHPENPWKRIAGLRDILTHQYDRVDADIIWGVVQQEMPELLAMITPLLPEESTD